MPRPRITGDHQTASARAQTVISQMDTLRRRLNGSQFEVVRPARWRNLVSGFEVETGYTHGEGKIRVYEPGSRQPKDTFTLLGRDDELSAILQSPAFI